MTKPLHPGSTIGIVGGGQLGRMLAMAAARLGYRTAILEPQPDCPAAQVANRQIVAAYDDPAALAAIAREAGLEAETAENVEKAILRLQSIEPGPLRILICGSLYLAGHVLALQEGAQAHTN